MKLSKVHKVLKFKQSDCLKEKHIDFNTNKKAQLIFLKKNNLRW